MSGLIYLASPYSDPNPLVREHRFNEACRAAAKLMQEGNQVFSPIAHSHPIERHFQAREGHDFWLRQDFAVLRHCSTLVVLRIEGWGESHGVGREIEFARDANIPLEFMDP